MNKILVLKLAGSAVVLGTTLVGCNPAAKKSAIASASDMGGSVKSAASSAAKAEKALKANDFATAIASAENAVAASPRNASYRMLLGQAYMAGGRFISAEMAFNDTLRLDPGNNRAALSMALAQTALGRADLARETLEKSGGNIPVADHGLALALAGDVRGALAMLEPAARAEGASGKTRQNLALTYALAGDWTRARAVAEQDVPADQVDRRLAGWAMFAQPRNSWDQVSTLLGVKAVLDRGQPERLALVDPAPNTALAAAEAPVEQQFAPTAEEVAAVTPVDPAPASVAEVETVPSQAFAARQEIVQPAAAALIRANAGSHKQAIAGGAVANGRFVVQLGAFSTPAKAEAAWKKAVAHNRMLAAYMPSGESVRSTKGVLHRVAAGGFASRRMADQLCAQVRADGGVCFVRANTNAPQAQWAVRLAGLRLAAR